MAVGLLRSQLPEGIRVESAGLGALVGKPADELARAAMKLRNLSIEEHRAQQIQSPLCLEADLLLVMDAEQKRSIEGRYPFTRGKVYRLGEFGGFDIFDPYGKSSSDFERCLNLIDRGVADWVKRIVTLS